MEEYYLVSCEHCIGLPTADYEEFKTYEEACKAFRKAVRKAKRDGYKDDVEEWSGFFIADDESQEGYRMMIEVLDEVQMRNVIESALHMSKDTTRYIYVGDTDEESYEKDVPMFSIDGLFGDFQGEEYSDFAEEDDYVEISHIYERPHDPEKPDWNDLLIDVVLRNTRTDDDYVMTLDEVPMEIFVSLYFYAKLYTDYED